MKIEPHSFYRLLEPTSPEEFGKSFTAVKISAFRLEMLDLYTVPAEANAFKKYLSGKVKPPLKFNGEWIALIKDNKNKGVDFQRVRLAREPVHNYLKFEVAWGYSLSVAAGEDIRVIMYSHMPIFKTPVPILKDFWLFDNKTCYLMEYDIAGQFLGVSKVPSDFIGLYINLKKEALSQSTHIRKTKI